MCKAANSHCSIVRLYIQWVSLSTEGVSTKSFQHTKKNQKLLKWRCPNNQLTSPLITRRKCYINPKQELMSQSREYLKLKIEITSLSLNPEFIKIKLDSLKCLFVHSLALSISKFCVNNFKRLKWEIQEHKPYVSSPI